MNSSNTVVRAGRSDRSARMSLCALLCGVALCLSPLAAWADGEASDMAKEAGLGVGSAFASLVYAPVKLAYASAGLVVGGLAWVFSGGDAEVAKVVLTPSVRGDYVITTKQLTGKKEVEFFGRQPGYRPGPGGTDVAAANDQWEEGW